MNAQCKSVEFDPLHEYLQHIYFMVSVRDYSYYNARKLDPIVWLTFIWCLKIFLQVVDLFLSLLFGKSLLKGSSKEQKDASTTYEKSAHIVKVLSRGTINLASNHDEANFLYMHDSYVHPNYILEHKNVILKTVKKDRAIFCVSDEDVSAYSSTLGPFLLANLFTSATKLIILPIKHFHRLAEERGDPFTTDNLKVTIIHMTTRCGSTLLGIPLT